MRGRTEDILPMKERFIQKDAIGLSLYTSSEKKPLKGFEKSLNLVKDLQTLHQWPDKLRTNGKLHGGEG